MKKIKEHILLWVIMIIAIIFFLLFTWATYYAYELEDVRCLFFGEFGDTFGMLNTLFSAFAMAFAGYAIYYQGKELKEQKKELVLSRQEFEATRATNILYKQIEIINSNLSKDGFELRSLKDAINYLGKYSTENLEDKSPNLLLLQKSFRHFETTVMFVGNTLNIFSDFEPIQDSVNQTDNYANHSKEYLKTLSKVIIYNIPSQYFELGKTALAARFELERRYRESSVGVHSNIKEILEVLYRIGVFAEKYGV